MANGGEAGGGRQPEKRRQAESGGRKRKAESASDLSRSRTKEEAGSPRTALDLMQRNVKTIQQLEEEARQHRSGADRVAEAIANFCGSMKFVYVHVVIFAGWIAANLVPGIPHLDPYPFEFLTLAVSLEAIFLSTFILISQNHDMRLSERRNHLDLQINMLTEQENTTMLSLLRQIATKIGIDVSKDPNINIMEETTDPKDLAGQIDQTLKKDNPT